MFSSPSWTSLATPAVANGQDLATAAACGPLLLVDLATALGVWLCCSLPACLRLLPLVYLQGGHPGVSSTCLCSFLLRLSCLYVRALGACTCTPPSRNYLACFATALEFALQLFLYTSEQCGSYHIDRCQARYEWRHQRTSTLIYVGGCRSRAMTGFDACCLGWRRRQDGDGTDDKQETPTDLPHHPSSC